MCLPKPEIPKANVAAPPPPPPDTAPTKFQTNEKPLAPNSPSLRAKSNLRIPLNITGGGVGLNA